MKRLWQIAGCMVAVACALVMPASAASVDSFPIVNYDVAMTLSRDAEQRSTLRTVETITADFPASDQNRGLEKVFVKTYDGHSTSLNLESVTDENGVPLAYHWSDDALRIGAANTYVYGRKTYVITYTQRDVTRYYADTGKDEFYWDVIGAEWRSEIRQANIQLTVDGTFKDARAQAYCYQGARGSNDQCTLALTEDTAERAVYTTQVSDLGAGKGLTVSLGFAPGTFAVYQPSLMEKVLGVWTVAQGVLSVVGVGVTFWLIATWSKLTSRRKELGTIVPEYLPPKDASVTASARLGGYTRSVMTAQLLDLAVRHYVKVYEVKEKTLLSPAQYEIEIVRDVASLRWEERELLSDMFGSTPTVGQRLELKELQNSSTYFKRTINNDSDLEHKLRGEYGLKEGNDKLKHLLRTSSSVLFVASIVLLSPVLLVVTAIAFGMSFTSYRLTDRGLALKRYLEGLKMYIGVAEEERLRLLQSPEGAEKVESVTAGGTDPKQLVKLYEKVLPYAVVFGQERQWAKQLGAYYENAGQQPDWYSGQSAFNAAMFSSAVSGLSTSASSASSYSSSSGGSSGGGSVGGGGGGGGGGGW